MLRKIVVGAGVPLEQASQECLEVLNSVGMDFEDMV
jgi:hypothetical protein